MSGRLGLDLGRAGRLGVRVRRGDGQAGGQQPLGGRLVVIYDGACGMSAV
ncbi:hypothetical protein [Amycolatopsis silviterrae]|uniref:DUF393 domain-containing protein n=1 Tax=Amycolatopsis silviterrae TaxID=1656914 RepID=A0ABW5H9C6_9PSEU